MTTGIQTVKGWFGMNRARTQRAEALYDWAVAQSRQPAWYVQGQVPDTIDGRFDLILLHLFALMERLNRTPKPRPLQRALTEAFFRDMDRSLREIGASDTGLPRRMRAMAEAYLGRMQAYSAAKQEGPDAWHAALSRNLLNDAAENVTALACVENAFARLEKQLAAQPDEELLAGRLA